MSDRSLMVARAAEEKFWEYVAVAYPEAEHGDLGPLDALQFTTAVERAVEAWVEANVPEPEWTREAFKTEAEANAFAEGLIWGDDPQFEIDGIEPCSDPDAGHEGLAFDVVFRRKED